MFTDLPDDLRDKGIAIEKTKNIFDINKLLKTIDFSVKQEQPVSIFNREASRVLSENDFTVSENKDRITFFSDGKEATKIFDNGMISTAGGTSSDAYFEIKEIADTVSDTAPLTKKPHR